MFAQRLQVAREQFFGRRIDEAGGDLILAQGSPRVVSRTGSARTRLEALLRRSQR